MLNYFLIKLASDELELSVEATRHKIMSYLKLMGLTIYSYFMNSHY